jgi:uncharacterized protein (DUF885 family)
MRIPQILLFVLALAGSIFAQDLKPVADRQNAFGDYRYNDQLDHRLAEYSLAAIASAHADRRGLPGAPRRPSRPPAFPSRTSSRTTSWSAMLQQRIADYGFKEYEMPVNQMSGRMSTSPTCPTPSRSTPSSTTRTTSPACTRFPRVFTQTEEVLRAGMRDNLMPVKFLLEKVPGAVPGHRRRRSVPLPTKKYPAEHLRRRPEAPHPADHRRGQQRGPARLQVLRGLRRHGYAPHGRTTLAVTSLPDGEGALPKTISTQPHHHAT